MDYRLKVNANRGEVVTFTEYRVCGRVEYLTDAPEVKTFRHLVRFSTLKSARKQFELVLNELREMFPDASLNAKYGEDGSVRVLEYYPYGDMPRNASKNIWLSRVDLTCYERQEYIDEGIHKNFLDYLIPDEDDYDEY